MASGYVSPRGVMKSGSEAELLEVSSSQPSSRWRRVLLAAAVVSAVVVVSVGGAGYMKSPAGVEDPATSKPKVASLRSTVMRDDDPDQSLYDKLGGAYPMAAVVDRFIDIIMVDPDLNANERVKTAHHAIGKAGFKYLVWEMLCQVTGGPCEYKGRSLKEAHWHLKITKKQWEYFVRDFVDNLNHFGVPAELQGELGKIADSVKGDIINEDDDDSELVTDPPKADAAFIDKHPDTIYSKVGGIYAISGMVDTFMDEIMVDAVLNENKKVDDAHHKVAPRGFKNMVTQFMASAAMGGPQKYVGKNMKDAHDGLSITVTEWNRFVNLFVILMGENKVPAEIQHQLGATAGTLKDAVVCNGIKDAVKDEDTCAAPQADDDTDDKADDDKNDD